MSRSNSYFGGYRGRRTLTDRLKIIAILLGVAVAVVLAALFFLQGDGAPKKEEAKVDDPHVSQMEQFNRSPVFESGRRF